MSHGTPEFLRWRTAVDTDGFVKPIQNIPNIPDIQNVQNLFVNSYLQKERDIQIFELKNYEKTKYFRILSPKPRPR